MSAFLTQFLSLQLVLGKLRTFLSLFVDELDRLRQRSKFLDGQLALSETPKSREYTENTKKA